MSADQMRKLVEEWSHELSERLGRTAAEIASGGLGAHDFSAGKFVEITYADGSRLFFKYAFALVSRERRAVAVFTEHCGYHVFSLSPEMVITERTDKVYFVD